MSRAALIAALCSRFGWRLHEAEALSDAQLRWALLTALGAYELDLVLDALWIAPTQEVPRGHA